VAPSTKGTSRDASDADDVQQLLSRLNGLLFTSVGLSSDGSLMIRFAADLSEEPARGRADPAATLWVHCAWRFESDTQLLMGRGDRHDWLLNAVHNLDKAPVTDVRLLTPFMDAQFSFADGMRLVVFPWSAQDSHWRIRFRDGIRLLAGPGVAWSHLPRPSTSG
jgi:hypothetical protein